MTKVRRTVTFSAELDAVLGLLASSSKQNLSEFLEYRLRELPEVNAVIQRLRTAEDPKSMVRGKIPKPVHSKDSNAKTISAV